MALKQQKYRDINPSFTAHPITGDVPVFNEIDSVKFSLKNLILTRFGERPMRYYLGSDVTDQLFDLNDDISRLETEQAIRQVVANYEPRVIIERVDINQQSSEFRVSINFRIINLDDIFNIDVSLKRIR